ncbi:MAG TPA: ASCH domain-containing protein [Polyangiales bacterium]|nr:ASCH domain-containing protein [Polyangiales bacterium]
MLLFQKRFHEGLVSGAVTLTFRRWARTHVRVGGRYRCHPIGVLEVVGVGQVRVSDITEADAVGSGFASRDELLEYMKSASDEPLTQSTRVFRVELRHGGDGDRVELALEAQLSEADVDAIAARLARLDAEQPWTRETLAIIAKRPRVAASQLAAALERDKLEFKTDVRKLKKLGLTQSFEVGYEISPRGRAYLDATAKPKRKRAAKPAR